MDCEVSGVGRLYTLTAAGRRKQFYIIHASVEELDDCHYSRSPAARVSPPALRITFPGASRGTADSI